jgi:hypothetical protein
MFKLTRFSDITPETDGYEPLCCYCWEDFQVAEEVVIHEGKVHPIHKTCFENLSEIEGIVSCLICTQKFPLPKDLRVRGVQLSAQPVEEEEINRLDEWSFENLFISAFWGASAWLSIQFELSAVQLLLESPVLDQFVFLPFVDPVEKRTPFDRDLFYNRVHAQGAYGAMFGVAIFMARIARRRFFR